MKDEDKTKGQQPADDILGELNVHHQALIYTIPDIVYFKDIQGRNILVNKAFEEFAGLKESGIVGKTDDEIFPHDRALHCRLSDLEVMKTRETVRIEEEATSRDGKKTCFDTIKSPLFDRHGNLIGVVGVSRDVTERRHNEEQLGLFRTLIDQSNDAIFIIDPETSRLLDVNNKACSNLWYSRGKLINMGVVDIEEIIPDHFSWEAHVKKVKEQGYMVLEGAHKRRDGTTFPVEVNVKYITQGQQDFMVAMVRDITERKQETQRYTAIIRSAMDAFWMIDHEGRFLDVNDAACTLLGYSREKLLHMKISDVEAAETPEDVSNHIRCVKETGGDRFESRHRRKDGSIIDVEVSVKYLDINGGQFYAFIRDITERKRAEERRLSELKQFSQELIESLPGTFFIVDEEGHIEGWNKYTEQVTGYSAEEIKRMNILDIIPEGERKYAAERMKETLDKGKSSAEVNLVSKDGEKTPYFGTASRITVNDKTYIVAMAMDISDRKRMEEEIFKAQRLDSIGILAGGIAHDFNNILTAILGNILLSKHFLSPEDEIYKRLSEAEKAIDRAQGLTEQLLTFSRGGAPVRRIISLSRTVRESADFALRGSNVLCEYLMATDLMPVEADEGQISQVIHNIVKNAEQAMPHGGTMTIRCGNITINAADPLHLREGNYVKLSIKDTGVGIAEEHLSKIFDPYFTTKEKGTGLGLATSYSIIKKHDGLITVDSKLGVGTTFNIYLPACEKEIVSVPAAEEVPVFGKGKILVMDDEEMVRNIAGEVLGYIGYKVEFAADGQTAIELYRKARDSGNPFDLLIMDLTIPGAMGGMEALKELLKIDPGVKAIVSSGYSIAPVMAEYRRYGFKGVITKPYKIRDMSSIVHDVLHGD